MWLAVTSETWDEGTLPVLNRSFKRHCVFPLTLSYFCLSEWKKKNKQTQKTQPNRMRDKDTDLNQHQASASWATVNLQAWVSRLLGYALRVCGYVTAAAKVDWCKWGQRGQSERSRDYLFLSELCSPVPLRLTEMQSPQVIVLEDSAFEKHLVPKACSILSVKFLAKNDIYIFKTADVKLLCLKLDKCSVF